MRLPVFFFACGAHALGLLDSHDFRLSVEGAEFCGDGIQVVELAVVGICRHACHGFHLVDIPRGEDEQAAIGTCLETLPFGLPVGSYGLFLEVDEGVAPFKAFVLHQQFAARDAGGDDDRLTAKDGRQPLGVVAGVVGGGFVGLACDGMTAVALHLQLVGPAQEEEVAESAIAAAAYLQVEAALQYIRQGAPQDGPAGVVLHVGYHGIAVAAVEAHRVVVVLVEKGLLLPSHEGVVFAPLPVGEAADQGAFGGLGGGRFH